MKAQVGQKLFPKDCLAAAAAAQRNTRSAENLSLKHLPAGPGRPNQYQKIKKARLFQVKYIAIFSSRALRAQNRWSSKKFGLSPSFSLGLRIFLGAASGCKTLLFASVFYPGKNASTSKIFKKNVVYPNCGPPRAVN